MKQIIRIFALTALLLGSLAVTAQTPHTVDFTQLLIGLDGKPMLDTIGPDAKPVTLSFIATNALRQSIVGDDANDWDKKLDLYALAKKIHDNKSCSLSAQDITIIKARVGKLYNPEVVGAVQSALEK